MAGKMQHAPGSAMKVAAEPFVNRSVVRRCVITALLAIPGLLRVKDNSSVVHMLASVVIGCSVMVVVVMPLALLSASKEFAAICSREYKQRVHPAIVVTITISCAGVAIGFLHGMALVPPASAHLLLVIGIGIIAAWLVKRQVTSTLAPTTRSRIDAIALASGVLYGAITGSITVPFSLIAGTISIGSSMLARGSIVNETNHEPGRDVSRVNLMLVTSACAALVSLMMAPVVVPMVYPVIASAGCALLSSAFLNRARPGEAWEQARAFARRLVSLATFLEAAALFLCSA